jgi:histidyl-tRNA synthetase
LVDFFSLRLQRGSILRILDSKSEVDKSIIKKAPILMEHLDPMEKARFERVLDHLQVLNIPYTIDYHLMRGLDYYNDTVFEIQHVDHHSTLIAGGRYDTLVSLMSQDKIHMPAIGGAAGVERLADWVVVDEISKPTTCIAIIPISSNSNDNMAIMSVCLRITQHLRHQGYYTELIMEGLSAGKKTAIAIQHYHASLGIFVGSDELQSETATIKNFETRTQYSISMLSLFSITHVKQLEDMLVQSQTC